MDSVLTAAAVTGSTSNADRGVRLVTSVALIVNASEAFGPDVTEWAGDICSKGTSTRHILHVVNGTAPAVRGVSEALERGEFFRIVQAVCGLGFFVCEHALFLSLVKPTSLLRLDSHEWTRRAARFMVVNYIISVSQALVRFAQAVRKGAEDAFDRALDVSTSTLELCVALTRSQIMPDLLSSLRIGFIGLYVSSVYLWFEARRERERLHGKTSKGA